jgi:hypothetical protein
MLFDEEQQNNDTQAIGVCCLHIININININTLTHTMQRLPQLPSVADLIRTYGLSAKSQLAQNFILDLNITRLLQQASSSCMLVEA